MRADYGARRRRWRKSDRNFMVSSSHCEDLAGRSAEAGRPYPGGPAVAASTHPVRAIAGAALLVAVSTVRGANYNDVSIVDDDGKSNVGLYTSIAIGSDHLPIISYYDDTARSLKVAHCEDRACATPATITVVDDDASLIEGRYSSIAIGDDGLPVISYQGDTGASLRVAKCVDIACASPATITDLDTPAGITGTFTSIAIGNNGRPVVSYTDDGLKVARCANPQCTGTATVTLVDPGAPLTGYHTSIAIGLDGFPIVSYYDLSDTLLRTVKCGNSACSSTLVFNTIDAGGVGEYTAIGVRDDDGIPVIAYHDAANGALKLAICAAADCVGSPTLLSLYTVPGETAGVHVDMVLANNGRPFVSHRNETTNALVLTTCLSANCGDGIVSTELDRGEFAFAPLGEYTSIAIGTDRMPIISYHDASTGSLKVVHCRARSCDGVFRDDFDQGVSP